MEWVLFVSLQWIVLGSPTNPTSQQIDQFASEELCNKAAEVIRTELNTPIGGGQRVQTLGRVVCVARRDK
jgi:hypothetical protein